MGFRFGIQISIHVWDLGLGFMFWDSSLGLRFGIQVLYSDGGFRVKIQVRD